MTDNITEAPESVVENIDEEPEVDAFQASVDEEEAATALVEEELAEEEQILDAEPQEEIKEEFKVDEDTEPEPEADVSSEELDSEQPEAEGEEKKDEPAAEPETEEETEPSSETPPETEPSKGDTPELTLDDVHEQWGQIRETAEADLAEKHYALSDEEVAELSTNAEVAIPKMMAKVYMDAVQASITHVVTELPRLLQNTQDLQSQAASNEKDFFDAWPQLKEHKERVFALAATYRQVNPDAPLEQTIRDVGAQAVIAMQIPVDGLVDQEKEDGNANLPPHRPPGGGGSPPASPPKIISSNPFEQMAEEMLGDGEELDLD
tara:strand:+ start:6647 stop:7609 length:963 start_codon:yes stop_codon:yes gene_type:complete